MKKIIFVTMIISSCHIDALQQRLSRLWNPARQAARIGLQSVDTPAMRTMANFPEPVTGNWRERFGSFLKSPLNYGKKYFYPSALTDKPLNTLIYDFRNSLAHLPSATQKSEFATKTIDNLNKILSVFKQNNIATQANSDLVEKYTQLIGEMTKQKNLLGYDVNIELAKTIKEIEYEAELDEMIDLEIFYKGGISITRNAYTIEEARRAIADLYYFCKPNFDIKMSEVDLRNKIQKLFEKIIDAERSAESFSYTWLDKITFVYPMIDQHFFRLKDRYLIKKIVTKHLCDKWINQLQGMLSALEKTSKIS